MRMIDADIIDKQIQEWIGQPGYGDYYSGYDAALYAVQDFVADMPTLTPPNEWVSVEERPPKLPNEKYCWVCVLGCKKTSNRCMPMFYERTVIRGKTVERWKDMWDRITNESPDYWMPLPAPSDRRPPEGEVV